MKLYSKKAMKKVDCQRIFLLKIFE
jgi:hypothetical protein